MLKEYRFFLHYINILFKSYSIEICTGQARANELQTTALISSIAFQHLPQLLSKEGGRI